MREVEQLERIFTATKAAWKRIKTAQTKMWGDWMTVGEGLQEGQRWAMQQAGTNRPEGPAYRTAINEWLLRYGLEDMHKADRSKLMVLMENRAAVEEWRATLTDYERRNTNNPTLVYRKWQAANRVRPRRPRGGAVSITQHNRAMEQAQERIRELEEENQPIDEQLLTMIEDETVCRALEKWAQGKTVSQRATKAYHLIIPLVGHTCGGITNISSVQRREHPDEVVGEISFDNRKKT